MRSICIVLHRYIGLATALFLVLLGLTGSVLAWREPLSAWLAPELHHSPARGAVLSLEQLAQHAHVADPAAQVILYPLSLQSGDGVAVLVRADGYDTLWLDPVSGSELGRTNSVSPWPTTRTLVDWLYHLHRQLAMPGRWGVWILGIVSLLWFFDCFIGAYLTLPPGRDVVRRWLPAWKVNRTRVNYDLHRAGGLWPWLLLAVMALSGVYFNLNEELFMPALRTVATVTADPFDVPVAADAAVESVAPAVAAVSVSQAATIAINHARTLGWSAAAEGAYHDVARKFWYVYFEKPESQWATAGGYSIFIDDRTGAITHVGTPGGTAGDVFLSWLGALHMGGVFGTPYKVVLCLLGVGVAMLSGTGVLIWWRKLCSRRAMRRRRAQVLASSVAAVAVLGPLAGLDFARPLIGALQYVL